MEDLFSDTAQALKKVLPCNTCILTHVNPDGDAIGSMLGLYHYLVQLGCRVVMAVPNEIPDFLVWMKASDQIRIYTRDAAACRDAIASAELIFCLDFNEPSRLKGMAGNFEQHAGLKIMVDHHPDPVLRVDHGVSDPGSSSTAELIYRLIEGVGTSVATDADIAACLYAGIMTDTGNFSFNSSNPRTFLIVADLLARGIDKDEIYSKTYDHFSADRMRLLGYSLHEKMVWLPELRSAYIALDQRELEKFQHVNGDTEGFVNYPFSIRDVRITALFIEKEDHVKISFRSKGSLPINEIAREHFNGGGHLNAAGGESFDDLESTIRRFISVLTQLSDEIQHLP